MNPKPLCFVLMPLGQKPDPAGGDDIDFDFIYSTALAPAIRDVGMLPLRADEEMTEGIIHNTSLERLLLCDYAIVDLTTADANVFYQLGVRHAARPASTLTIFARQQSNPFDVNFLRSMSYDLGGKNILDTLSAQTLMEKIREKLQDLKKDDAIEAPVDSPLFDLLKEWKPGNIARLKTDIFRENVQLNDEFKTEMLLIRKKGCRKEYRDEASQQLLTLRDELGALDSVEVGTAIDLMLTYRAIEDWDGMISVFEDMPVALRHQILVREQLGFAYNRRAGKTGSQADREQALQILVDVEKQQGSSSETCGLIGRIHKDNWKDALDNNDQQSATGHLDKCIEAYSRGFMIDQRDAYPGINVLTLLDIKGDKESLKMKDKLLPVVQLAVEQRIDQDCPDYWDHATMVELAVLNKDFEQAIEHLNDALSVAREPWEPKSTADNLTLIQTARNLRKEDTSVLVEIIERLQSTNITK